MTKDNPAASREHAAPHPETRFALFEERRDAFEPLGRCRACAAIVSLSSTICDSSAPSESATSRLVRPKARVGARREPLTHSVQRSWQLRHHGTTRSPGPSRGLLRGERAVEEDSSIARFGPMARGKQKRRARIGREPDTRVRQVNFALAAHTARSAISTSPTPAPAAVPFTAAITGASIRTKCEMASCR